MLINQIVAVNNIKPGKLPEPCDRRHLFSLPSIWRIVAYQNRYDEIYVHSY